MKGFSNKKKNPKDVIKAYVNVINHPCGVGAYAYILSYNSGERTIIKSGSIRSHEGNVFELEKIVNSMVKDRATDKHNKTLVTFVNDESQPLHKMAYNRSYSIMKEMELA